MHLRRMKLFSSSHRLNLLDVCVLVTVSAISAVLVMK